MEPTPGRTLAMSTAVTFYLSSLSSGMTNICSEDVTTNLGEYPKNLG